MIFRCYSETKEKICLQFYPCNYTGKELTWEEWHKHKPLTIFSTDYNKLLLPYLTEIYPIKEPFNDEISKNIDLCFDNWIEKKHWLLIINNIKNRLKQNNNRPTSLEREFYTNSIEWLETKLEWADLIIVEGNL